MSSKVIVKRFLRLFTSDFDFAHGRPPISFFKSDNWYSVIKNQVTYVNRQKKTFGYHFWKSSSPTFFVENSSIILRSSSINKICWTSVPRFDIITSLSSITRLLSCKVKLHFNIQCQKHKMIENYKHRVSEK